MDRRPGTVRTIVRIPANAPRRPMGENPTGAVPPYRSVSILPPVPNSAMRILFVAHGYPPSEIAGTERHVESLARHALARGHTVRVVAATRSIGRKQYASFSENIDGVNVTRIVNNVTTRSLADIEADRVIDGHIDAVQRAFRPDVIHLHHLQFLSSATQWRAPVVITLHDQWFWCAAGGLGVRADRHPCDGPSPDDCAPCAAAWRPTPGRWTRALSSIAGHLSPVISPATLHRAWAKVPQRLRPRPERGVGPTAPPLAAEARNRAMAAVLDNAKVVLSPSRYLADRCTEVTGRTVHVLRHGLDEFWFEEAARSRRSDVLFLGTIAPHKGPDLVVEAWRRACPEQTPPLRIHGMVQDPALTLGHPISPALDRNGVRDALDRARVVVMGSRWPENAPLVILEARARGCPVVAPAIGGIPELLSEQDGHLFEPDDVGALADALRAALERSDWAPRPPPTLTVQAAQVLDVLAAAGGCP